MPLYSFRCHKCNHKFDVFNSMEDRHKPLNEPCINCGEDRSVYRVYNTQGFVDPGILKADKNMERSGVEKELNRLKEHHPYMSWKG